MAARFVDSGVVLRYQTLVDGKRVEVVYEMKDGKLVKTGFDGGLPEGEIALPHDFKRIDSTIVVLVDGGTAGTAEALARTLQVSGRAKVVGASSEGRAAVMKFETTGTGDAFTYLLPVVLTSAGQGGTLFSTELTLANRSGRALNLTFRAKGTFEASSTYTLSPGQQIFNDVYDFLSSFTGMAVPGGNKVTSLRIEVRGADNLTQFGAQVRVMENLSLGLRGEMTPSNASSEDAVSGLTGAALTHNRFTLMAQVGFHF